MTIAVCLALLIRTFLVQAFKIPSGSMIPTLTIGDHVLVNKFIYGIRSPLDNRVVIAVRAPRRGDIIVFKYPEDESKDFIKRVIGEPGDLVEVRSKRLYINGAVLDESYAVHRDSTMLPPQVQPRDNFGPVTVPAEAYFVMGDNRDQSLDSRFWGFVKSSQVKGRAFLVYWSWRGPEGPGIGGEVSRWVRWGRIGRLIE